MFLTLGSDEGRMMLDLKQFTTADLLTALSAFILTLENETPNMEEQVAVYAVCSEIESRRRCDSRRILVRTQDCAARVREN
ncbi:MAG TPA: hypothetical protein VNY51_09375 [Candidatus Dormibacteraeota bacterium]|jgi:hypothetical protein|nr:hypothetical protein [Candidatus Dormibacteraeota bacterium]